MELRASEFAKICGVKRQSFNSAKKSGKVKPNNDEIPKYNIYEPVNMEYLKAHDKSVLDVEAFVKSKNNKPKREKVIHCRTKLHEKKVVNENSNDESLKLIKCVSKVIENEFGTEQAKKIKYMILQEFKN